MATVTEFKPPREFHLQAVHFLRGSLAYTDTSAKTIGRIPHGAIILPPISGLVVTTAFDDSGTDLVNIGYGAHLDSAGSSVTADPDAYATNLDASAAGLVVLDEAASVADADGAGIPITATYTGQNANASAGAAQVIIAYITDR